MPPFPNTPYSYYKVNTMANWLTLDIGTTGTKAALMEANGQVLRSAYRDYPTQTAEGGVVEQDVRDWWQAAADAARELNPTDAEAIVITGQMQNVILLDASGEPVRPVILYSDSRAHAEAAALQAAVEPETLRQLTGNDQEAGSLIAKLRWLMAHEPQTLERAAHLLVGAADAIAFRLTGKAASDTTTASTTGLMDISTRAWLSADDLARCGIASAGRLFANLRSGGSQIGAVLPQPAAAWQVRPGIPVYLAPGDAGAATLGAGSGVPGYPYAYIGTSGWVAFTADHRALPESGVFTLAHPQPERFICVAPLLTAAGNFDWAKGLFGADSHAAMIDAALAQPPARLLYLPYLNGERSPFSDPFARGAFIGLEPRHTQPDLVRAVLEGVAFAYRHALDSLLNTPIAHLVLTGGGTRSAGWCQMIADITGVEVSIAPDAANVGLRGAVLAARVADGAAPNFALADSAQQTTVIQPDSARHAHYDRQYRHFRAAYPALKSLFADMAADQTGA
jgi:xylulokinase